MLILYPNLRTYLHTLEYIYLLCVVRTYARRCIRTLCREYDRRVGVGTGTEMHVHIILFSSCKFDSSPGILLELLLVGS